MLTQELHTMTTETAVRPEEPISAGSANDMLSEDRLQVWLDIRTPLETTESPRPFRPARFAAGLAMTTAGVGLILFVGVRVLDLRILAGEFAMALVGFCVLSGIMLLGAGFGLMATAAASFDEPAGSDQNSG